MFSFYFDNRQPRKSFNKNNKQNKKPHVYKFFSKNTGEVVEYYDSIGLNLYSPTDNIKAQSMIKRSVLKFSSSFFFLVSQQFVNSDLHSFRKIVMNFNTLSFCVNYFD